MNSECISSLPELRKSFAGGTVIATADNYWVSKCSTILATCKANVMTFALHCNLSAATAIHRQVVCTKRTCFTAGGLIHPIYYHKTFHLIIPLPGLIWLVDTIDATRISQMNMIIDLDAVCLSNEAPRQTFVKYWKKRLTQRYTLVWICMAESCAQQCAMHEVIPSESFNCPSALNSSGPQRLCANLEHILLC